MFNISPDTGDKIVFWVMVILAIVLWLNLDTITAGMVD